MKIRDNAFDILYYWDEDRNAEASILFIDFTCGAFTVNKSYLIKEEDIKAASKMKKENSISCLRALKLRFEVCTPANGTWDIKRAKTPLREFVREFGLELYLDMSEVIEVRNLNLIKTDINE